MINICVLPNQLILRIMCSPKAAYIETHLLREPHAQNSRIQSTFKAHLCSHSAHMQIHAFDCFKSPAYVVVRKTVCKRTDHNGRQKSKCINQYSGTYNVLFSPSIHWNIEGHCFICSASSIEKSAVVSPLSPPETTTFSWWRDLSAWKILEAMLPGAWSPLYGLPWQTSSRWWAWQRTVQKALMLRDHQG